MGHSGRALDGAAIEERVRDAHLNHFCPGGLGVPLTSPSPAGMELDERPGERTGHAAAAAPGPAGPRPVPCDRCGCLLESGQDVRRRASGGWAHENCPPSLLASAAPAIRSPALGRSAGTA